ncbi:MULTISPECIES: oligopeptide/dipeptide ABC transporter ATP-binding protein [unclassified Chelatococcus]|uniref:ABC transporter ATP-binding protein n=1 Tax=unclassified Chelatococcus TaxID=2638111 RepID=UPI001BCC1D95|nr:MULTISPECIES: oligopeptide/dipeptide ABC transporter ATP-binding protein [unclassified Chelatococcus]CAH1655502.1 murein tripeptide ABC transporter/oligopeptide ABC transporter ATP binding subunit OppF [Hyphomicrobiales bacterium]MBS7742600.1 ATP-binding cassette domain-containing protein [Chelatococcus sp. HY11]MBX3542282.1 ATP-binding cassette domain-containing protein [Chelatococcus sp.]MCO5075500.1 ATP-binding cassette domain-containing protein [Chelatococcus sp.]CAH1695514.1 murein tri
MITQPGTLDSASPASSTPPALVRIDALQMHFDVTPSLTARLRGRTRMLKAIDGVSFEIPQGATFSLVGESGCGKSTVARCVVGLYQPTAGRVVFDGVDMAGLKSRRAAKPVRRRLQMIFQDPYASLNPRWRVADIIAEPLRTHGLLPDPKARMRRVEELLSLVSLQPQDAQKYPHEFSGGQRQRISIARALAGNPEFLVCDEPTSALDVSVQAQILNLMRDLQQEFGLTYLFISHNLAAVSHMSDQLGVMYLGRLVECGDARKIFDRPLHPYTQALLAAIPDIEMGGAERQPMAGDVPSPIDPPSGCTFHPRCPLSTERCRREAPQPRVVCGRFVSCHYVT